MSGFDPVAAAPVAAIEPTGPPPPPPADLRVSEQHAYAVMAPPAGLFVTEQHAYAVQVNTGLFVTEQHAYALLVPQSFSRRRQVMLGSF